jgi:hypothetical protein
MKDEMRAILALVSCTSLALVACGSGAKQTPTIAGVGVETKGPPPTPSTPGACARRWNAPANMRGRTDATRRAPNAQTAVVRRAGASGYFSDDAGRCLVYVITPLKGAVVFVETRPGTFTYAADANGHFSANADIRENGSIQVR